RGSATGQSLAGCPPAALRSTRLLYHGRFRSQQQNLTQDSGGMMIGLRSKWGSLGVLLILAGLWTRDGVSWGNAPAVAQSGPAAQLTDDPALKANVSAELTDLPLSDALVELARQTKVDLSAEAPIGRQRVTLHLSGQPLSQVMARLTRLLSHSLDARPG